MLSCAFISKIIHEETKMFIQKLFAKKWFRFLLELVVCITVIAVFFNLSPTDSLNAQVVQKVGIGSWSMLGVIVLFVCFDVMGDCENFLLKFLRILLLIVGALVTWGVGFAAYFSYTGNRIITSAITSSSPWAQALITFWFLGGVFISIVFAKGRFRKNYYIQPLLPLLCEVPSYFICVLFAYLGKTLGSFFYWVPLIAACFLIIAFVSAVIHGEIKLFKSRKKSGGTRSAAPSAHQQSESAASVSHASSDSRKEYKDDRPIKNAIFSWVHGDARYCVRDSVTNKLENLNCRAVLMMKTCTIEYSGTFIYDANYSDSYDVELKARDDYNATMENIVDKTKSICQEICETYQGYDGVKWKISTSGIKCVVKNIPAKKKQPWE